MTSAFDETFGRMPERPDHPDLDRLIDVVLRYTSAWDELSGEERELAYEQLMSEHVHLRSASYMALQRAFRPLGITTQDDLRANWNQAQLLTTVWLEGFLIGCRFKDAGGHRES